MKILDKAKIKATTPQDWLFYALLFLFVFLPFQFALNPYSGIDLAIVRILIPVLFIFSIIFSKKIHKLDNISLLILTFLFLAAFSLSYSVQLFWSLRKLAFLFSIFPIYFVSKNLLANEEQKLKAASFLVIGAFGLSLIAITQFIAQFIFGIDNVYDFFAKNFAPFFLGHTFANEVLTYPSWLVNSGGNYLRATATFPDPHMLSYFFGILLPWSIALSIKTKYKLFFLIASVTIFTADILTFTRGAYLALIVGAILILPLVSMQTAKKILVGIMFMLLLFKIIPSPVASRFSSSFNTHEGSNQGRIYNWKEAIPVIIKHPLGVGIGMYPLAVNPDANYREPIYAHNLYLDIAAELGIPALIVFFAILYFSFINFWKKAKENIFFTAGVFSVAVFSFHSLVETPLYSVHVLTLFLAIIALSNIDPHEKISNN